MLQQNVTLLLLYLILCAGLIPVFKKAGQKSWTALVPFYNAVIWLRIIQRPWWWVFLLIVPGVNFLMLAIMAIQLAKAFGVKSNVELAFAAIAPYFYLHFIGYSAKYKFIGVEDTSGKPKSMAKEWTDAIVFAVVAATVIRTFFIEAFTIPTSSLEKSLMVGDYLFVSKMSYGSKLPNTPLAFPFSHHTLPFTQNTKSYLEWIKIPYFRLPGFRDVSNNDLVVFNYPDGDTVASNAQDQSYYKLCREFGRQNIWNPRAINPYSGIPFGKIVARPPDKRENYIKRCVAIAGDTFQIKNAELYINGKESYTSPKAQFTYMVETENGTFNKKMLDELDITEPMQFDRSRDNIVFLTLTKEKAEKIKQFPFVKSVTFYIEEPGFVYEDGQPNDIFPHSPHYRWNKDNFGPLVIPKAGTTVELDTINLPIYERIIDIYENNDLRVNGNDIYINGEKTNSYTFKMDYYFMMGDNRHNSADSRYWGFVPEDHIVGTPVFIWMSLKDPKYNPFSGEFKLSTFFTSSGKARWDRFFTFVNNDGLSRSYLLHFLVIMGGIYGFRYFRKRKAQNSNNKA